ncbi:MAG: hypothetical protein GX876_10870 [Bacteroidales bacterium]|nr:hypothetical protein [Bacteroidales bacterium]
MKSKYVSLEPHDQPRIMKVLQIIFGAICIIVFFYYLIYGTGSTRSGIKLWTAIVFLLFFGIYQIMAGLGKTKKYFIASADEIKYKQHSFLPCVKLTSVEIGRIIFHPLSIIFQLKKGSRYRFRFGISYPEVIDPVKQNVIEFAESHNISFEIADDEM